MVNDVANGGMLGRRADGRLTLNEVELLDGAELEVLWNGSWMLGKLEYVWWRRCHRLWCAGYSIDLMVGMHAKKVLED